MGQFLRHFLRFEPLVVLVVVYVFWIANASRVWALLLLLPFILARWLAYRRLVSFTPLNFALGALLIIALLNLFIAPYNRGATRIILEPLGIVAVIPWSWVMLGRLLMGMAVYFTCIEYARNSGIRGLIAYTVSLGLIVGVVALLMTQWNSKSAQMAFLIDRLPALRQVWLAPGGFNANEIAGAIGWLTPLCAGLGIVRWKPGLLRVAAWVAFGLLLIALVLGQSRLALGGVFVGLVIVSLLLRTWRQRTLALLGVAALVVFQGMIILNVFAPPGSAEVMQTRDEGSTAGRFEMYISVLRILEDHPWTGAGMNMYRDGQVRELYPVPHFTNRILPHAHNEVLQLAADFGYPGIALFIILHGLAAYMTWYCWRHGDRPARIVAVSAAAGLVAHGLYGTGDAIALWDRFIFVYWGVLGLLGAQYVVTREAAKALATRAPEGNSSLRQPVFNYD